MSQHYIFTLANGLCWQERGGIAISLFNTWGVMICTQRGALVRGRTSQSVSFNRACLQWLGIVDSGSCSAEHQTERSVSFPRLLTPSQSSLTTKYEAAHTCTDEHTHSCSLCQISDGETNIVKSWGRSRLPFLPRLPKLLGLRATLAVALQLSHHYTVVHSTASVLSILNQAGTKLISLSFLFSCLWGCWIFCD